MKHSPVLPFAPAPMRGALGALLAATALVPAAQAQEAAPQPAASADRALIEQLVERIARLEGEVASLRAAPPTPAAATPALARREESPPPPEVQDKPQEQSQDKGLIGFHSGNSSVVLSGYVKLLMTTARYSGGNDPTGTLGRDVYVPQSIPVYNPASPTSPTRVTDIAAKQTRFWVDADTHLGHHTLKGYIEMDFQAAPGTPMALGQGTQRTTNAYDLAMRRAYVQFDRWLFGQDFSTFAETSIMPESTDYLGAIDGLVFVRQPQVRYTVPLGRGVKLNLAVENPETASATLVPDATSHAVSAALIENGEDHAPDVAARLDYAGRFGQIYLAGLLRQLRVDNAGAGAAHVVDDRIGWGVSTAGKILLGHKGADWRFQATWGSGIGRYLGLNFGPDAVLTTNGRLGEVRNLGLYSALHVPLTQQWRVNLLGSFQHISYASSLDHGATGVGSYNAQAWSAAGNLFYSPVPNVDFGVEYRHGERALVDGLHGSVDRLDFAAKYAF